LERVDNTEAFDDEEKAECLAQSLELQCSPTTQNVDQSHLTEVDSEVERRSSLPAETTLDPVTVEEVQDLIKSLKPRKAPGIDGINNRVLKLLPGHLIIILVSIFNAAITNCSFPAIWKEADVIGIHKPGKPANKPSSYRPISLLSTLSKLYERVILSRLRDFAISKHLLPDEQFGFRARHSCVQQVHRITEHILSHFAHRPRPIGTAALFLDVAKAFDKVWHNGLSYRLYQFGVPDKLVL
ncbi:reverse transcriptase family protein, partial [Desulfovibrio sp. DS-1]